MQNNITTIAVGELRRIFNRSDKNAIMFLVLSREPDDAYGVLIKIYDFDMNYADMYTEKTLLRSSTIVSECD